MSGLLNENKERYTILYRVETCLKHIQRFLRQGSNTIPHQFAPTGAPNAPAGPTTMTHCYNCGHAGTFVLLVQFALAVPGPEVGRDAASIAERNSASTADCDAASTAERNSASTADRDADAHADRRPDRADRGTLPSGDCSLAVQCPACDSTDVGVAASDLLARYGSTTTS